MELQLHVFGEPEASPFLGFRYRLVISLGSNEFLALTSNLVFDDWLDALLEAVREYREDWGAIAS